MEDVRNICVFIGLLVAADRYGCFLLAGGAVDRAGVRRSALSLKNCLVGVV